MTALTLKEAVARSAYKSIWDYPGVLDRLKELDARGISNLIMSQRLNEEFRPALVVAGLLIEGQGPKTSITRNAVIAKRDRIGSPRRSIPSRKGVRVASGRVECRDDATNQRRTLPTFSEPEESFCVHPASRVGIGELTAGQCNWPIGDPQDAAFHWCNQSKEPGKPYCLSHAKQAVEAPDRDEASRPGSQPKRNHQQRGIKTCASYAA